MAWLSTKIELHDVGRRIAGIKSRAGLRFAAMVRASKLYIRASTEAAPSGREMNTERRSHDDDLKRSLIS